MEINICFGIDNNFCQHCGVTIASILLNSNPEDNYNINIITDYISQENIKALESLKRIRPFELHVHTISIDEYKKLNYNARLGIATFYRWKAFEVLDYDKVLYLDSDIIVRRDIAELYKTDIDGYFCAGAEDIIAPAMINELKMEKNSLYINAGVMLINLDYARTNNSAEKFIKFLNNPWERECHDQEILNYLFQGEIKYFDITWNCMIGYVNYYDKKHYNEVCKNPAIVHFITDKKPWIPGTAPAYKTQYFMYLKYTPWFQDYMLAYQLEEQSLILKKLNDLNAKIDNMTRNK